MYGNDVSFDILVGKTLASIKVDDRQETIIFETTDGERFQMTHHQDCCESVSVEDVCGELADLIGSPILQADAESNSDDPPAGDYHPESYTWTYYKLATIKGSVTLRWFGSSNGYYSERVDFERVS